MNDKEMKQKLIAGVLLAVIALLSAFWFSKVVSSPEFHQASIAAIDGKKTTVMELTAATAAASVVISLVPGDSTTPIADQVAELSSYLLIVTGVLMLEKFLLVMTGYAAFTYLIPIACALGVLYLFWPRAMLKNLAVRLAALGLALCLVIPISLKVSDLFENTFELQKTVQNATQAAEELEEEEAAEGEASEDQGGIGGWLAGIGDQISGGVSDAMDKAEAALSSFIDAVAVLVISNCVIPVLVLLLMLWVLKAAVSLPLDSWPGRDPALPEHRGHDAV